MIQLFGLILAFAALVGFIYFIKFLLWCAGIVEQQEEDEDNIDITIID